MEVYGPVLYGAVRVKRRNVVLCNSKAMFRTAVHCQATELQSAVGCR